jgi:hypothetical protein
VLRVLRVLRIKVIMKALSPIHRMVARELALGFDLGEICRVRKLDIEAWRRMTNSKMFKIEVARLADAIEEQLIQEAGEDPAFQKLRAARLAAADTLIEETRNYDPESGASAATRISASKDVLDRAGITKKQEANAPAIVINISGGKAELLAGVGSRPKDMPENFIAESVGEEVVATEKRQELACA